MNGSSGFENAVIQCSHQGTLGQFNLSRDGDILNKSTTNRFSHYHSFVTIVLQYEHADNCITSVNGWSASTRKPFKKENYYFCEFHSTLNISIATKKAGFV